VDDGERLWARPSGAHRQSAAGRFSCRARFPPREALELLPAPATWRRTTGGAAETGKILLSEGQPAGRWRSSARAGADPLDARNFNNRAWRSTRSDKSTRASGFRARALRMDPGLTEARQTGEASGIGAVNLQV